MRRLSISTFLMLIVVALGDDSVPDFESQVRPILAEHCYGCHGPDEQKAKLRLDNLSTDLIADVRAAERWHDVRAVLNLGEMPPDSRDPLLPQPAELETNQKVNIKLPAVNVEFQIDSAVDP